MKILEYLHPNDSVDKEEHYDEQSYMRKSLQTQTQTFRLLQACLKWDTHFKLCYDHIVTDLEGLDESPQQITDALRTVQQLDQTHDTEKSEERDGNWRIFRCLGRTEIQKI